MEIKKRTEKCEPNTIKSMLGVAKIKKKLSTSDLNKSLQKALSQKAPPATRGKVINLNYITQVSTKPHLFVIYANYPKLVPLNYRKYLENNLRADFDLKGIPFRISFRKK